MLLYHFPREDLWFVVGDGSSGRAYDMQTVKKVVGSCLKQGRYFGKRKFDKDVNYF